MYFVVSSKHLYFFRCSEWRPLNRRVVKTSIACVRSFIHSPRFTQRNFFQRQWDESACFCCQCCWLVAWPMHLWALGESAPWGQYSHFTGSEKSVWCCGFQAERGTGTSERLFGVRSLESSEVGETSCRTGVQTSDVDEVGQVEYLSESMLVRDQPCNSGTTISPRSPGKRKRQRTAATTPAATSKRLFESGNEWTILPEGRGVYFGNPIFECALRSQEKTAASRWSGRSRRNRRAAPVFQSSPR